MRALTLIDIKSAITGAKLVLCDESAPGRLFFPGHDIAGCDVIGAPDWVPVGSHRRLDRDEHGYRIVYGETLREGVAA